MNESAKDSAAAAKTCPRCGGRIPKNNERRADAPELEAGVGDAVINATDVSMPPALTPNGVLAHEIIMRFIEAEDLAFTGGCKIFYSPDEWRDGEGDITDDAVLVVVYDGAAVRRLFRLEGGDNELVYRFYEEMLARGLYVEEYTSCCAVVCKLSSSERERLAGWQPIEEGTGE